jgi:hypothetical protein
MDQLLAKFSFFHQGAGGDFPQICLWDRFGQLMGYNDQTIHLIDHSLDNAHSYNFEDSPQDIPQIGPGGLMSLGIWPAPGHERLANSQVTYVTVIKRNFDAICVSRIFLKWFDDTTFLL